jgi:methylmalonyl-CoA mutase N-terminal domain/subunit
MIAAIEQGFFRREIAEAAYAYQQAVDKHEQIIVGVNRTNAGREADAATRN